MLQIRMAKIALILTLWLLLWESPMAEEAVEYSELIQPYLRSELVETEAAGDVEVHRLILGKLKKINQLLGPEFSRYLLAAKSTATFYIPKEERLELVTSHFRDQLIKKGQMLFECTGRGCGSSNYWAHRVFKRTVLYGPEKYQTYMVALIELDQPVYVSVYTAQRSNRKIYAHLEVLSRVSAEDIRDKNFIVNALESEGKLVITETVSDESFSKTLIQALAQFKGPIVFVGHSVETSGVDDEIERTRKMAQAFMENLVVKGLPGDKVSAYGVGPLSPNDNYSQDRIEILLLR